LAWKHIASEEYDEAEAMIRQRIVPRCLSRDTLDRRAMSLPQAILDFENRNVGDHGEPTLGATLELAAAEWRAGNRDRELCLHLLFLAWYCNLEPPHLTGYAQTAFPPAELSELFQEVYTTFEPQVLGDAECLYVVGLIAMLTPYLLGGDETIWQVRSAAFRERYRALAPQGLNPSIFAGRGAYGDYFAGQLVVPNGY